MACFVVPAVEAIVVTSAALMMKKKENAALTADASPLKARADRAAQETAVPTVSRSRKLMWLAKLLWGGVVLLAFEHVWHGEVVPWFPFLTAMSDPASKTEMLYEMGTAGVTMAVLVTAVWVCMVLVSNAISKRAQKTRAAAEQE